MAETDRWQPMSRAPRDGTRILVTVRSAEQGSAEVDVAYWGRSDQLGGEGWRAADSTPGAVVEYSEPELQCWMPLPTASPASEDRPAAWEGERIEEEVDGSGI